MIDAEDADDFDAKQESVITQWKDKDTAMTSSSDVDRFIDWFNLYKGSVIRRSMLKGIREECGLGFRIS